MNKYQEALNFLDWYCEVSHVEQQELLQELVDRATPIKPISLKDVHGDFVGVDICRICDEHLYRGIFGNNLSDTYCSKCGTKIDWSNEEEV